MTPSSSNIQFSKNQVEKVYQALISTDIELKNHFEKFLAEEYINEDDERLSYIDIGAIAHFIVDKAKKEQTQNFQSFFDSVETIFQNCDDEIESLMVVGLFEGIQNISGREINYYSYFDKWLKPISKDNWDKIIDFWEGTDWRTLQE